jgi:hypothetical protein
MGTEPMVAHSDVLRKWSQMISLSLLMYYIFALDFAPLYFAVCMAFWVKETRILLDVGRTLGNKINLQVLV